MKYDEPLKRITYENLQRRYHLLIQSQALGFNEAYQMIEADWYKTHTWPAAPNIRQMLHGFKHILEIDPHKLEPQYRNGIWMPSDEFIEQFYFPYRNLGDHVILKFVRGVGTKDDRIFEFNELGFDVWFVATNNDVDATFLALKYM